ncbi:MULTISPECIES: hypothetical protein [Prevotellaceae]|uniref:hypothetical protein n=1 Tax=Prevotellaceae TaxID=171552 RepID=UPI0018C90180|nr:hypothetical protein [Prevotella phocaeensis]
MKLSISNKIYKRLMETPNSEFAQIWLQRMLKDSVDKFGFKEALCSIVRGESIEIWDNSWFNGNNKIKKLILPTSIFDKTIFAKMDEMIKDDEVDILYTLYDDYHSIKNSLRWLFVTFELSQVKSNEMLLYWDFFAPFFFRPKLMKEKVGSKSADHFYSVCSS